MRQPSGQEMQTRHYQSKSPRTSVSADEVKKQKKSTLYQFESYQWHTECCYVCLGTLPALLSGALAKSRVLGLKTSIIKLTKQTEGAIAEKLKELEIPRDRNKIGRGENNLVLIFKDNIEINKFCFWNYLYEEQYESESESSKQSFALLLPTGRSIY